MLSLRPYQSDFWPFWPFYQVGYGPDEQTIILLFYRFGIAPNKRGELHLPFGTIEQIVIATGIEHHQDRSSHSTLIWKSEALAYPREKSDQLSADVHNPL
jgi:hypothetical protein